MSQFTVYMAGAITGLNFDAAQDWRDDVKEILAADGIHALSPLRSKQYLRGIPALTADCKEYGALNPMSSPRGLTTRDRWDAMRCDVLLVNLLGATRVSIGTVMEIAWADSVRKPIVLVMEPEGNVHEHAMITECTGYRVPTLTEAIAIIVAMADTRP